MGDISKISRCENCWYYRGGSTKTCDYIFIEDRPRPCPPGECCTVRITRKDHIPMKKPKWDTELGHQMYLEGKSDHQIADEFGVSTGTVTSYRRKHWEPATVRGGESAPEATLTGKEGKNMPEEKSTQVGLDLFDALEAATSSLSGIRAICTANAIQALWNWGGKEDLQKARANIDHLLKKLGE